MSTKTSLRISDTFDRPVTYIKAFTRRTVVTIADGSGNDVDIYVTPAQVEAIRDALIKFAPLPLPEPPVEAVEVQDGAK